jgi:hypothetical protein
MMRYNPLGCKPGYSRDPKTYECILRHQEDCPDGQVNVPNAGVWEGRGPDREFIKSEDKCMAPISVSPGNMKTGGIPTWSIPSGITCPSKTPLCEEYCYAKKSEIAYPDVLPSRRRNLWASKQPEFVPWMTDRINRTKSPLFRIHESGDFYNKEYQDKWYEIAKKLPDKKFLAYTKNCSWDWTGAPSNMMVVCSIWPDSPESSKKSKMRKAYAYDPTATKMPEYPLPQYGRACPALRDHKTTCDKCRLCWDGKADVLFTLH